MTCTAIIVGDKADDVLLSIDKITSPHATFSRGRQLSVAN